MELERLSDVKFEIRQDRAMGMNSGVVDYATGAML